MSWTSPNCWGFFISNRYLKGMWSQSPKRDIYHHLPIPVIMAVSWNRGTTKFRFGFAMICPCKTNHFGVPPFNQKGTSIPSPETQRKYHPIPLPCAKAARFLARSASTLQHLPSGRDLGKRSTPQKTLDFTGLTNKHGKSICKSLDFIGKNGDLTNNHGDSNIQTWDLRI